MENPFDDVTDEEREEILDRYFAGGRLKEIPAREKRKLIVLERIAGEFEKGRRYKEEEVNQIIFRLHPDTAAIRRFLFYYGFMDREPGGGAYWLKEPPATLGNFARRTLACLPTPLVELPRFTAALGGERGGPRILMKRDDQTGLATGGNKARKLEFLVGDAIAGGCDALVTGGAAQSNHCRQTAAAAAACGLECHLALAGEEPATLEGNLLLDALLGARFHWTGERRKGEDIPAIAESLRARGLRPYEIPYGGSNPLGALGFAAAYTELAAQLASASLEASRIVFASSSGGTQAGLMVGKLLSGGSGPALTGICIDKAEGEGTDFAERVLATANGAASLLGLGGEGRPAFGIGDVELERGFVGSGYGIPGELERRATRLLARDRGRARRPGLHGARVRRPHFHGGIRQDREGRDGRVLAHRRAPGPLHGPLLRRHSQRIAPQRRRGAEEREERCWPKVWRGIP